MSIRDRLLKAQEAIGKDVFNNNNALGLAHDVGKLAIEAITFGLNSPQGKRYMALFCDNPNELLQLTTVRDTDKNYMKQSRAYIAANAVCTADTGTQLANGVIDETNNLDIEPPAAAFAPEGATDPADIRDDALFQKLQA
jgi:hypothetical protein